MMNLRKELNFRELGGIVCDDGRHVKKGQFYRCGALADLNEEELQEIRALHIRHIFDFRSNYESSRDPDPYIEGAQVHLVNAMTDRNGNPLDFSPAGIEKIQKQISTADGRALLTGMYYNLPFSGAYQEMFAVIRREETPILFHCSAGKDRTGIAAVLILMMLGVSEEDALDDYMLTNEYRAPVIEHFMMRMKEVIGDEKDLEPLIAFEGVARENAEVSLQAIRERCGDFETYLMTQFGITAEERIRLRDIYTE